MNQVVALYRYPVKSMQGEQVQKITVSSAGVAGDRALALQDAETGLVVSAHRPDRWGQMLHCQARWDGSEVVVTLPDGSVHGRGAQLEHLLSDLLGRPVIFLETAPADARVDFTLADVPDSAPGAFERWALSMAGVSTGSMGRLPVGMNAPTGSLVDVAPVHLITDAALRALAAGGGDPDVRRFRPNIVVTTDTVGYAENGWLDRDLTIGAARMHVTGPTMRCLVTTLAQAGGLQAHRANLITLARENRLVSGPGSWACLGVYATPDRPAVVAVADHVSFPL